MLIFLEKICIDGLVVDYFLLHEGYTFAVEFAFLIPLFLKALVLEQFFLNISGTFIHAIYIQFDIYYSNFIPLTPKFPPPFFLNIYSPLLTVILYL